MRPGPKYTIDRVDVNGNYEPGNVRWATWTEQRRNRRDSLTIVLDVVRVPMIDEFLTAVYRATHGKATL